MDKLDRFEKILNLVERARRLDFIAIEAMERMNKTNIDFYNFYTKIDKEKNKQYYTNKDHVKEPCVIVDDMNSSIQNTEKTEYRKDTQMEQKPEYSEEALRAFINSFNQSNKSKDTVQQPQQQTNTYSSPIPPPIPYGQYAQHAQNYGQPVQNPYNSPYPQQQYTPFPQPPQQPQMAPQQTYNQPCFVPPVQPQPIQPPQQPYAYNVNINAASLPPENSKEEEETTPIPPPQTKDPLEKIRSLSSIVSEKIRVQTDVLKQTHEAFTETYRMSFMLWKEIDEHLSKNKMSEK